MKKALLTFLLFLGVFTLSACDELLGDPNGSLSDETQITIEVLDDEASFNIHTFSFSDITIKIYEEDADYTIALEESMLVSTDAAEDLGRHYFEGSYQGVSFYFFITLYDGPLPPQSEEEVTEYFNVLLDLFSDEEGYAEELELPDLSFDEYFEYEYVSSNPEIIHPNGLFNEPTEDTEVTITIILSYPPHDITMSKEVTITVYGVPPLSDTYFFPDYDFEYDGPRLDLDMLDVTAYEYDYWSDRYVGTGGAFTVDYTRCIDGDTTGFYYPNDIYQRIEANAKSTRYFNLDTPETTGNGEEWGRNATIYVCNILDEAESIILQTDPGDNLLDVWGRLLAWIWVRMPGEEDYQLLNYMIVRQGLGEVAYLFGAGSYPMVYDGMTYTEWMWHAEDQAFYEGLGLHGDLLDYYWDYDNNRTHPDR